MINGSKIGSLLLVGAQLDVPACGVSSGRVGTVPFVHSLGLLVPSLRHTADNHDDCDDDYINKLVLKTPTGIRTASKMMVVVDRPLLLSSVLLPPWVVTDEVCTVMFPNDCPEFTAFLIAFSVSIAAFDPAAAVELTARLTEEVQGLVMERMAISLIPTPEAVTMALRKLR